MVRRSPLAGISLTSPLPGVDEEEVVPKSLPSSLLASKNFSKPLMEKLNVDKWLRLLCFEIKMRIEFDFEMVILKLG